MEKLQLDVAELRRRTTGKLPDRWLQRIQSGVLFLGILFTAVQFRLSVREAYRKNLLIASEHLHEGYLSGARELEQIGDDGLQTLVDSIDPAGTLTQKAWPATTRAALAVLSRYRLSDDQWAKLVRDMDVNFMQLDKDLRSFPAQSNEAPRETIKALYCVQLDLQHATRQKPRRWVIGVRPQVVSLLGDEPHC